MSHTPTPWAVDGYDIIERTGALGGVYVAKKGDGRVAMTFSNCLVDHDECLANAAFIVRACNSHDELLAALRLTLRALEPDAKDVDKAFAAARAAVQKAETA